MTREQISLKIERGDYKKIAELTGYERETIRFMIKGRRTLSEKVRQAAIQLIENRDILTNQK